MADPAVVESIGNPEIAAAVNYRGKYDEERAKRLRDDGVKQYIVPAKSNTLTEFMEDPWVEAGTPVNTPVSNGGHCKFVIIGAGFGGVLFAVRLIQAGFSVDDLLFIDPAGGFGGTWYWNRYPGLMCDVESYIYMPLLEDMEYMPKRKYASGEELRAYVESVCRKFDLHKRAMFQSAGQKIAWNEDTKEWETDLVLKPKGASEAPYRIRSDYVLLATGVLTNLKLPDLEGSNDFQGQVFHTARWRYDYTGGSPINPELIGLKGKRVGIIGTGATAVQAVPEMAKWAEELYVFQRTPSAVDVRNNHNTDAATWKTKIATKSGWQRERNDNYNSFVNNAKIKPEVDMVDDGWTNAPSYSALIGGPYEDFTNEGRNEHIEMLHKLDYPRQERIRQRTGQIVKDPQTAESLQAWYPTWCKRPCFHDDYLQAFNSPNVKLIDTKGKGVDRITPAGIQFDDKVYEIDVLIFGTGFEPLGSPAAAAGIEVIGRGGRSHADEFANNLSTLHGVCTRNFPNLFWPGPRQSGVTANHTFMLDNLTSHVAYIIAQANRQVGGKPIIEPTVEAQEKWTGIIMSRAALFAAMGGCTPSYLNSEGETARMTNEEVMKAVRTSIWGRGITSFLQHIEAWRADDKLEGLEVRAA